MFRKLWIIALVRGHLKGARPFVYSTFFEIIFGGNLKEKPA